MKKKKLCEGWRSNLNTKTIALKFLVSCETLGFNHAFPKTCQNATMDEKVYKDLKYVVIKSIKGDLQKCIT